VSACVRSFPDIHQGINEGSAVHGDNVALNMAFDPKVFGHDLALGRQTETKGEGE
jgi:hypothetical protein